MKKIFLSFLVVLFMFISFGCSKNGSLIVERSLKRELVELNVDTFKEKVNSNLNLVVFVNSSTCQSCKYVKETFLNQFIQDYALKIYSFVIEPGEGEKGEYLKSISKDGASYLTNCSNSEGETYTCAFVPLILIIQNQKVINYALGTAKINYSFFNSNLLLDSYKKKINVTEEEKIRLQKSDNPSFITYDNQEIGIIYNTNAEKDNQEMLYYLKPFMEEYQIDIFINIDSSLTNNSLTIKNGEKEITVSKSTEYLNYLESYIK